ncbi:MAG: lactonase family protein [Candidatus Sulfotelmatobacter sp.]
MLLGFLLIGLSLSVAAKHNNVKGTEYLMYVGTYTVSDSTSKGIYAYRFDPRNGQVTALGLAAQTVNPSFLTVASNHRFLYAVNETGDYNGQKSGTVSAFSIDQATGKLTLLNQVASGGADPCYISMDKAGKFVLVANYTGGSIAVFPVLADGRLGEHSAFIQHTGHGPNPQRQEAAHAHSIDLSPDNHFAVVDDLGLDETLIYKFDDAKGELTPNDPPFAKATTPGAGPRHFALSSNGKFGYVVNEMASTVSVFSFDPGAGVLSPLQAISTLPKEFAKENTTAEILIGPSGKYLYASNRGNDSIAVFAIDSGTGKLTLAQYAPTKGESPRNFEFAPGGSLLFVGNEKSDNITIFQVDGKSGRLTPTGKLLEISQPVCIRFVPIG